MAKVDYPAQQCDVDQLLKETSPTNLDFIIDGIHFGRGDAYYDQNTSTQLKHKTTKLKCWRIVNESLEEVEDKTINNFYSSETYIIQWESITDSLRFNTDDILSKHENKIYFYWKGESAAKGFSPLPESIEKDTPPVERIVQWAEPPAFLQLFSGTFIVHLENCNKLNNDPHLYIVRGEIENEIHLYEISLQKKNLRSRTSFVMYFPKEKSSIIWHGANSNSHCKDSIKTITGKIFGSDFTVISESSENEKFLKSFPKNENDYFHSASSKIIDYTPRLFYFNKITGSFSVTEIECSHKSAYLTPFPFLQSHLYTAEQPAIFLLDDNDEIWIWYGWQRDEDNDFKSECFITAINYAKQKSNIIKRLVKVHKVVAGFEPDNFTNLFPTWKKREDIAQIQEKVVHCFRMVCCRIRMP
ncbi:supervillin-like isoform X2 [Tenebrio molitor]|uniref:supervillin-like isoform X2 n=1 Tax=Tenebrio molitor TaxID=7067 RepID=UPI003624961D